jgi:hypothetical protein
MWKLYALTPPPPDSVLDDCVRFSIARMHDAVSEQLSTLSEGQSAFVRYEDLVAAPLPALARLGHELRLPALMDPGPAIRNRVQAMAAHVRKPVTLDPEERILVRDACRTLVERFGYG